MLKAAYFVPSSCKRLAISNLGSSDRAYDVVHVKFELLRVKIHLLLPQGWILVWAFGLMEPFDVPLV